MMNENLPFGIAFQVAAGCMLTHMLISYLIKGVVMCKSVHVVALMLLSIAWFLGNIVPFFGACGGFVGSKCHTDFVLVYSTGSLHADVLGLSGLGKS